MKAQVLYRNVGGKNVTNTSGNRGVACEVPGGSGDSTGPRWIYKPDVWNQI